MRQPRVSGVGPRPLIGVRTHWGSLGLCAQAAGPLIRVHTHLGFQVWVPSLLIWVRANRASGVCWGCLSQVHSPGAEGGGALEAAAAAESSLNSHWMPLFSLFLFKKFFLFQPPGPNKHLASHRAQPGSLPRILQQTLRPGRELQLPWSQCWLVPGTLLSLSTLLTVWSFNVLYFWSLIFTYAWDTVGCSLCSSDQLGTSLLLRGSGLHSHLSRRHLPLWLCVFM